MLAFPLLLALTVGSVVDAQGSNPRPLPNSFPHLYPDIPNNYTDFSDTKAWQDYFLVQEKLPNVTFHLEESFAGNLPVNRQDHPNDTLFFWGFSHHAGSLTRSEHKDDKEPWMIWLNGGPGSSSMLGLLFENGPLHIANDYSAVDNEFGWNTLADCIWIDQPVGTGFSTADSKGYIADDDQMARDFAGFLSNLVKVFPSLAHRPLYITGESYAGTWIPAITKEILSLSKPPVNLAKMAIGDCTLGTEAVYEDSSVVQIMKTYPQLIDYDPEAFEYFKNQHHLCGYDVNLTYPQTQPIPPLRENSISTDGAPVMRGRQPGSLTRSAFRSTLANAQKSSSTLSKRELELRQENKLAWKRDLSNRPNDTIDPFYECFVLFELLDYAVNFTAPWDINDPINREPGFDVYDMPDALNPEAPQDGAVFLNDPRTRAALHAPTSKNWSESINYPFGNLQNPASRPGTDQFGNPSPPTQAFLSELATNSSRKGVEWIIYSGNDDFLVGHFGTEIALQNTTFCGTRGFTRRPSTPLIDDHGEFAGIIHQECLLTYILFDHAGHLIPQWQPERSLMMVRDFILGNKQTGRVLPNGKVVGGEGHKLVDDILPGEHNPIFTGSGTTMGSTLWPSATIAAWDSFIATATATPRHEGL